MGDSRNSRKFSKVASKKKIYSQKIIVCEAEIKSLGAFYGPPRTTPMFWIIFCDFNRPHSINWSCFILVYGVLTIFLWVYTGIFDHFWNTPASVKTSFLDLSPQNSLVIPKNYLEQLLFIAAILIFFRFVTNDVFLRIYFLLRCHIWKFSRISRVSHSGLN